MLERFLTRVVRFLLRNAATQNAYAYHYYYKSLREKFQPSAPSSPLPRDILKTKGLNKMAELLLSELVTDFLEHLEIEQNRSLKTISNYDHYLRRLVDFTD